MCDKQVRELMCDSYEMIKCGCTAIAVVREEYPFQTLQQTVDLQND